MKQELYEVCRGCGARLRFYYLKDGMCNGCRNPHLVVKAVVEANLYSVHLCGGDERECEDVEIEAPSRAHAEQLAFDRYPEFKAVRAQSEWNPKTKDWDDYE